MMLALEGTIEARGCRGSGCENCPYEATGALTWACRFERGLSVMSDVGLLLRAVDPELARRWSAYVDELLPDWDEPTPEDGPRRLCAVERARARELLAKIRRAFEESPAQLEAVRAVFPEVDRAPLGPEAWIFDSTVTVYALADLFRVADEHGLEILFGY